MFTFTLVTVRTLARVVSLVVLSACAPDSRGEAVESGIPAISVDGDTLQLSLAAWMDTLGVPGVSIAVIDNYEVVWARGYGSLAAGDSHSTVNAQTVFQAASIAKPVTALTVMHHVERGDLNLDADIRTVLRAWTLPGDGPYAASAVTLRQLLSHTAGIKAGGFAGYERSSALPTTLQILNGEEPALNTLATIESAPGEGVAYSGLGYMIVQVALEDQRRAPFAAIVDTAVFTPLQMKHSSFARELPERVGGNVAKGHFGSGAAIVGGWQVSPEAAAAGLWTTPSDLAEMAIDIAESWSGRSRGVLTQESAREMLTPQRERMGLGFVVRPADTLGFFSHSGGNLGYRAHMEMFAALGKGVVVMTNSDAGHPLSALIVTAVARAYGWPDAAQRQLSEDNARLLLRQIAEVGVVRTRVPVATTLLTRYSGHYELAKGFEFSITADSVGNRLLVRLGDQARLPAYALSERMFFFESVEAQLEFVSDAAGHVTKLLLHQGGRTQEARRLP